MRMKWFILIWLLFSLGLLVLLGCSARTGQALRETFWPSGYRMAAPALRPGLVLPVHRSSQVWALSLLFKGGFGEVNELILSSRRGYRLIQTPLVSFVIPPAGQTPRLYTFVPLYLNYQPSDFSLLVFYQSNWDRANSWLKDGVLYLEAKRIELLPFATTGQINRYTVDGRVFWADQVVALPKMKQGEYSQFEIHLALKNFSPERVAEIKKSLGQ